MRSPLSLRTVEESTVTGQLRWALGSDGFERSPSRLTGTVCIEDIELRPLLQAEKDGGRFNLGAGGIGTLRASHGVCTHT